MKLTRRRLLGGLAAVGSASAAAGAGTVAFFSDSATSEANDVVAGTIDLTLDGTDGTVTFLDATQATPGDQGSGTVTLANAGSIAGDVEIELTAIRSNENGYYGAENGNADNSPNDGELDEYLEVRGTLGSTAVWSRQTVQNLTEGHVYTPGVTISGGGSSDFTLEWWLPSSASNDAQSDGVEFDLTFRLVQGGAP